MILRTKNESPTFKKGDKVWPDAHNLKMNYASKKISPKNMGPFTITEVLSLLTYRLKLPNHWKIHDVFHIVLLKPYRETEAHGPNYARPPPELVDREAEYEVERILKHRRKGKRIEYLVRWKDYDTNEDSWEPVSNLKNTPEVLNEYKTRHQL